MAHFWDKDKDKHDVCVSYQIFTHFGQSITTAGLWEVKPLQRPWQSLPLHCLSQASGRTLNYYYHIYGGIGQNSMLLLGLYPAVRALDSLEALADPLFSHHWPVLLARRATGCRCRPRSPAVRNILPHRQGWSCYRAPSAAIGFLVLIGPRLGQ